MIDGHLPRLRQRCTVCVRRPAAGTGRTLLPLRTQRISADGTSDFARASRLITDPFFWYLTHEDHALVVQKISAASSGGTSD